MRTGERVYNALRGEIQQGVLSPGTVLGEVEQSMRLGVSRTPLREALDRLETEGLVVRKSPRITTVAQIGVQQIRELFVLRRALEEAGARLAASVPQPRFTAIAEAFERSDVTSDLDAYYALVADFDNAIDAAVANAFIARALQPVRAHLGRVRRLARDNPARLRASAAEHALIARAIAAGDGDLAAHATHIHLHNALASIELALADTPSRNEHP